MLNNVLNLPRCSLFVKLFKEMICINDKETLLWSTNVKFPHFVILMRKVVLTEYLHATMLFTGPFFHKRIPNKLHISYACSIIYEMTNFMAASEYMTFWYNRVQSLLLIWCSSFKKKMQIKTQLSGAQSARSLILSASAAKVVIGESCAQNHWTRVQISAHFCAHIRKF